jgi:ligand-binding sensor domain-containing protein
VPAFEKNRGIKEQYQFTNYSNASGIGSNYVYSIMPDSKNRVWFATDGRGVTMYENGRFINFNEKSGLKSTVIYSLCEDKDGNIWFSTLNAGLYKYDGVKFTPHLRGQRFERRNSNGIIDR